jgi:hypothetical protein
MYQEKSMALQLKKTGRKRELRRPRHKWKHTTKTDPK